jgi:hypothetical protein
MMGAWLLSAALLLVPLCAAAQTPAATAGSVHRPWVGLGIGWGNITSTRSQGPDVMLAATLEMPLVSTAAVRLSAERIWSSAQDVGDVSLRQVSGDLVLRRPFGTSFGCTRQLVVGLGAGVYGFAAETGPVTDATRVGYQASVGGDCVGGRLAIGGALGFRFVDAPDHPAFSQPSVVAPSLTLTIRIRL